MRLDLIRAAAHWAGVAMLVVVSALGFWSAQGSLGSISTAGQLAGIVAQFGYAVIGVVAAWTLVRRRERAPALLWVWAALVAITGGLAPVVWGGTEPGIGLMTGATSAAIAGVVAWLATRRR
jgi:hypothetical protein